MSTLESTRLRLVAFILNVHSSLVSSSLMTWIAFSLTLTPLSFVMLSPQRPARLHRTEVTSKLSTSMPLPSPSLFTSISTTWTLGVRPVRMKRELLAPVLLPQTAEGQKEKPSGLKRSRPLTLLNSRNLFTSDVLRSMEYRRLPVSSASSWATRTRPGYDGSNATPSRSRPSDGYELTASPPASGISYMAFWATTKNVFRSGW
mmetsp:Transcript_40704/g.88779  ORF Transcript_40704/g.88779 Transcript_40704/m.88779 type:complete len:203 (+) Transcript_40704:247-855(+)